MSGYILTEVDSTLDEARRVATGLAGPTWIIAKKQTSARGRRGRAWVMPEGNFAATLVLQPNEVLSVLALRSFVMSLAVFDAVTKFLGSSDGLALKWPNDVLLNGGKLAGILLESTSGAKSGMSLAIGVGVNLIAFPEKGDVETQAVRPVSVLSETGVHVELLDFVTCLAQIYDDLEQQFQNFGFGPIRHKWMTHAARLGEVITARTGTTAFVGTFMDVDKEGCLVLETDEGRVVLPAADVYF
ncbi:MAG: biotin--[acetyl-CoA-carboxylase] ligase [Paracoccaceae bacterium]